MRYIDKDAIMRKLAALLDRIKEEDVVPAEHATLEASAFHEWNCSKCWSMFKGMKPDFNFCPKCGARFDRSDEE